MSIYFSNRPGEVSHPLRHHAQRRPHRDAGGGQDVLAFRHSLRAGRALQLVGVYGGLPGVHGQGGMRQSWILVAAGFGGNSLK